MFAHGPAKGGVLEGHARSVWALTAADAEGTQILSASFDNTLRLWRRGDRGWAEVMELRGHTDQVTSVAAVRCWDAPVRAHALRPCAAPMRCAHAAG